MLFKFTLKFPIKDIYKSKNKTFTFISEGQNH